MAFIPTEAHMKPPISYGIDFNELDKQLAENIESNLQSWFSDKPIKRSGSWFKIGNKGSLAVNSFDGHWHSHETDDQGHGLLSLYAWHYSVDLPTAASDLSNESNLVPFRKTRKEAPKKPESPQWIHSTDKPTEIPDHSTLGEPDEIYKYRDLNNNLVGVVCRWNATSERAKEIRPLSWVHMLGEQDAEWKPVGFLNPKPLYRGERLNRDKDAPVIIVEGEKAADALECVLTDYIVITWCGGTGQVDKSNWEVLKDRDVTIWPDNDDAGRKAALQIRERLPQSKIMTIPSGVPEKWDAADAIAEGWTGDGILDEINKTDGRKKPLNLKFGNADRPRSLEAAKAVRPDVIIEGLLYAKSKLLIGGVAKAGKSHFSTSLAASLARGEPFLKWPASKPLKVIYVDFELHEWELDERCESACRWDVPDNLGTLPLREHYDIRNTATLSVALDEINASQADVIVLDCLYKFNDSEDENDNAAMKRIGAWMDEVIAKHGVAVILIHHFGKGSQGNKDVIDRFRGASSIVGEMDGLVSIVAHETEGCYIVDSVVRSFAPTAPFVARWDYPHWELSEGLSPSDFAKPGAQKKTSDDDILRRVPVGEDNAMFFKDLRIDLAEKTFQARIEQMGDVSTTKKSNSNNRQQNAYYR